MNKKLTMIAAIAGGMLSFQAYAIPIAGQINPIAIYHNTQSAFGLAYDPVNNLIHYSQGDSGDNLVHNVRPYKDYSAAELAALPDSGGIKQISLAAGQHDAAGTTNPGGSGGSGSGAHFSALAFDSSTGKLVQTSSGDVRSYDPLTAANQDTIPNVGRGFADGLDFDGSNRWFSGDVGSIFNNNSLFASDGDASKTDLPIWTGLGSRFGLGWSGVEQVGDSLFAVAVQSGGDAGRTRTLVRFDIPTGELVGYDPDGDPVAARWEDLAYDGSFLYAADLRGDSDGNGVAGDIYVFGVSGGLEHKGSVPEPSSILLLGLGLAGLAMRFRPKSPASLTA